MRRRRVLIVLGTVLFAIPCLGLAPCSWTARDSPAWARSANSLKMIGIGLQGYHEVNGHLPPAVVKDANGRALYSWRVAILPYIEEVPLHNKFRLDEPWDSPSNKELLREMPRVYQTWYSGDDPPGQTRFQVFVGPGTAFERDGLTWSDFPDGLDKTLLVAQAATPAPWSQPVDLGYDPAAPVPSLGGVHLKAVKLACHVMWREPGFVACMADGRGLFVRQSVSDATLRALVTRNGGETVDRNVFD